MVVLVTGVVLWRTFVSTLFATLLKNHGNPWLPGYLRHNWRLTTIVAHLFVNFLQLLLSCASLLTSLYANPLVHSLMLSNHCILLLSASPCFLLLSLRWSEHQGATTFTCNMAKVSNLLADHLSKELPGDVQLLQDAEVCHFLLPTAGPTDVHYSPKPSLLP